MTARLDESITPVAHDAGGVHSVGPKATLLPNDSVHKLRSAPTQAHQAHSDKRRFAAKVGPGPRSAKRAAGSARFVSFMH